MLWWFFGFIHICSLP